MALSHDRTVRKSTYGHIKKHTLEYHHSWVRMCYRGGKVKKLISNIGQHSISPCCRIQTFQVHQGWRDWTFMMGKDVSVLLKFLLKAAFITRAMSSFNSQGYKFYMIQTYISSVSENRNINVVCNTHVISRLYY